MDCAVVLVEGKNDYAFFGQALSDKSFDPRKFDRAWSKIESTRCENAISGSKRFFRGNQSQLFGNGDNRVMLIQSNGKQNAKQHFWRISSEMAVRGTVSMKLLLIIDSDTAPDHKRLRARVLEKLAGHLEKMGVSVVPEPADPASITSACTASKLQQSLRVGVMTIPTNFEEVFAGFLAKHYPSAKDAPPKTAIADTIGRLELDGIDGLCRHAFGNLREEIKRDPTLALILKELCEFVHD